MFAGCVGKQKYLEALHGREEALSRFTLLEADLADAKSQLNVQRSELSRLKDDLQQARESRQETNDATISATQQLSNRLREDQQALDELAALAADQAAKLESYQAVLSNRTQKLGELRRRLGLALADIPARQYSLVIEKGKVVAHIDPSLIFGEGKPKLSAFGDALLSRVASALGGRRDIELKVVCPRISYGSATDKENYLYSVQRSQLIVENLVIAHSLFPSLVSSSLGESGDYFLEDIPGEKVDYQRIIFEVRLQGDPLEGFSSGGF